jgi:uncharacterized protein (DUF302 family)
MTYALTVKVDSDFDEALAATREHLSAEGFGVLTEIDLAATLKNKLGVDVPPQVILGACRPPLAHAALQKEPSVGLLLPCNVVVRSLEPGRTLVEAVDPGMMVTLTGNEALQQVAAEARDRLDRALAALSSSASSSPSASTSAG